MNEQHLRMFMSTLYDDAPRFKRAETPSAPFTEHDTLADPFTRKTSQARFGGDSGVIVYNWGDDDSESEEVVADRKSKTRSFSTTEQNSDQLDQWAKRDGVKVSDIIHDALKAYAEKRGDTWQERNPNPIGDPSYLDEWRKSNES